MLSILKTLTGSATGRAITAGEYAATYLTDLAEYAGKGFAVGAKNTLYSGSWKNASLIKGSLVAGAKFGGANVLDSISETPWAQDSNLAKAGLFLAAGGMRMSGFRSLARGAVGSGLYAGGALHGDPGKYFKPGPNSQTKDLRSMLQHSYGTKKYKAARHKLKTSPYRPGESVYDQSMKLLGSSFQRGSIYNAFWAGGKHNPNANVAGAFKGAAKFAGRTAVRTAMAPAILPVQAARGMWAIGGSPFRAALGMPAFGRTQLHNLVNPTINPSRGIGKMLSKTGVINKYGELPMMTGMFAGGVALGVGAGAASYNRYQRGQSLRGTYVDGVNPRNWGGGVQMMPRGPAKNFGPALTLQLHHAHTRRLK